MFGSTLALAGAFRSTALDVGSTHPRPCKICDTIAINRFEYWVRTRGGYVYNPTWLRWEKRK